jgi:hypothetical protein
MGILHVHEEAEMTERIHIVVGRTEKERYRRLAAREGKTLSEWLRTAAREKLEAATRDAGLPDEEALRLFFAACDEREQGREPDWESHLEVMARSRTSGSAGT